MTAGWRGCGREGATGATKPGRRGLYCGAYPRRKKGMAATTSTKPGSLRLVDYANLSVLGFGLAALSTSLGQIILPMRVLDLAPESLKNTYLGILTFVGMATAMLVQPAVGYLSDRTNLSWGRRRPYVAVGGAAGGGADGRGGSGGELRLAGGGGGAGADERQRGAEPVRRDGEGPGAAGA